jgi:hypothetical protein
VTSLHIQQDAPSAVRICAVTHTTHRRRHLPVWRSVGHRTDH